MSAIPRIATVSAKPDQYLAIAWKDGFEAEINLAGLIARLAVLAPLDNPAVFKSVALIDWGTALGWADNDDLTLSSHTLRRVAEEQSSFDDGDFTAWQERLGLSNQEAADVLGVTLNTVKNYRSGGVIPSAVAVACRAMAHDNVLFMARFRPRRPGRPTNGDKSPKRNISRQGPTAGAR
jgi:hypothetical protein